MCRQRDTSELRGRRGRRRGGGGECADSSQLKGLHFDLRVSLSLSLDLTRPYSIRLRFVDQTDLSAVEQAQTDDDIVVDDDDDGEERTSSSSS
jgi:hypothetical protein